MENDAPPTRLVIRQAPRYLIALALMTLFEARVISLIIHDHFPRMTAMMWQILGGHAPWRAYQNRLLGPVLMGGIAHFTHIEPLRVYFGLTCAFLLGANLLWFWLFWRATGRPGTALGYAAAGAGMVLALQDKTWLYLWDGIDLIVFTLFAYGVFTRKRWTYFLPLFIVELLNREGALYIPVWIALDALDLPRARRRFDREQFLAGGALTGLGAAWTLYIRERMFRGSLEPTIGDDALHPQGNHFTLFVNFLRDMPELFKNPNPAMEYACFFLPPLLAVYLWLNRRYLRGHLFKAALLFAVMLAATMTWGLIVEPRMFLVFIPFLLFFHHAFTQAYLVTESQTGGGDAAHA